MCGTFVHSVLGLLEAFSFENMVDSIIQPSICFVLVAFGQPIIIGKVMAKVWVRLDLFKEE